MKNREKIKLILLPPKENINIQKKEIIEFYSKFISYILPDNFVLK